MQKFLLLFLLALPIYATTYIKNGALHEGVTTTATSGGTTALNVNSATVQQYTGTLAHTVVLPNATTLAIGRRFKVLNRSTLALTVQSFGGAFLKEISPNSSSEFITTSVGTSAGSWDAAVIPPTENPDIAGPLILSHIATPSNPDAGKKKLYFKSNGLLYKLDNSGTETEIGGGGFDGSLPLSLTEQGSTPANPGLGIKKLYFKSDGKLYKLSSGGVETEIGSTTGTVTGPVSSLDNAIASFGGLGGATLKDSGAIIKASSSNIAIGATTVPTLTGTRVTLLGKSAGALMTNGIDTVAIGADALKGGNNSATVAIGANAAPLQADSYNVYIGTDVANGVTSGNSNVWIGASGNLVQNQNVLSSIIIGTGATPTGNNQLIFGSPIAGITDAYIGEGVTDTTPLSFTLNSTGSSGLNVAGSNMTLASGKATGNAAPGLIIFKTSTPGSSGSALQSLTDRMYIGQNYIQPVTQFFGVGPQSPPPGIGALEQVPTLTFNQNFGAGFYHYISGADSFMGATLGATIWEAGTNYGPGNSLGLRFGKNQAMHISFPAAGDIGGAGGTNAPGNIYARNTIGAGENGTPGTFIIYGGFSPPNNGLIFQTPGGGNVGREDGLSPQHVFALQTVNIGKPVGIGIPGNSPQTSRGGELTFTGKLTRGIQQAGHLTWRDDYFQIGSACYDTNQYSTGIIVLNADVSGLFNNNGNVGFAGGQIILDKIDTADETGLCNVTGDVTFVNSPSNICGTPSSSYSVIPTSCVFPPTSQGTVTVNGPLKIIQERPNIGSITNRTYSIFSKDIDNLASMKTGSFSVNGGSISPSTNDYVGIVGNVKITSGSLATTPVTISVNADNAIFSTVEDRGYVEFVSTDPVAANRTVILGIGVPGQRIIFRRADPTNAMEILATANQVLRGDWIPADGETLSLVSGSDGKWYETGRSP